MILSRYLMREVFGSLLAVTFVLLLIFLSQQLVRYLSYAASGKLAANMLLQLLGFEIPYLLALLLPLGLYLGIILAYGRLYTDNEMSVMQSCGLSQRRLMVITGGFTLVITLIVLLLTLWINPLIAEKKVSALTASTSTANIMANLMPGRFQVSNDGRRVVYVERISHKHKIADNVFFADQAKTSAETEASSPWSVVSAARGYQAKDKISHRHFLVAENGYRYEGRPGQNDYKIIQFGKYAVQNPGLTSASKHHETENIPTIKLWGERSDPSYAAELQWRISIPLSAFLLSLLAIPFSHVRPRQGRYSVLLPAILLYIVYVNLLFVARNWLEQATIPTYLGLWWVHLVFLGVFLIVLLFRSTYFRKLMRRS